MNYSFYLNEIIIMFISSNYLSVSGEHRVHYNTNVCSRFCCTPRPFQAYGYPSLLPYMGVSVFILVFRQECVPNTAVQFKAISPITQPYRFFFLSTCTTLNILFLDFSLSPVFTAVDSGIWHSTEIDSCLYLVTSLRLLRLLISIRPDTLIFLTGEQLACFSEPFCAVFLCWYLLTVMIQSKHSAFRCCCFGYEPNKTSRENSSMKRKSDFLWLVLPLMYPSSHKVTFVKGYIPYSVYGILRDRASGFR